MWQKLFRFIDYALIQRAITVFVTILVILRSKHFLFINTSQRSFRQADLINALWIMWPALREKCPSTEFFLVRISLYSV